MKKVVVLIGLLYALCTPSWAREVTVMWDYNSYYYNNSIVGFHLYSGTEDGNYPTLVKVIPKSDITIESQSPILIEEHFNTDPGNKYSITKGSWSWQSGTKNMKIESDEFMVVFEVPAGENSFMSFWFWPEKSTGDQPTLYSYIKDEAMTATTGYGAYYELRLAGANGTRYSNWRKCYDGKYGGVDPNGAYGLPRYNQCNIVEGQSNICNGFNVFMAWSPSTYAIGIQSQPNSIENAGVDLSDASSRALSINKLEIILNQQHGWIDDVIIGGRVVLQAKVDLNYTSKVYLALTAYRISGSEILESDKSMSAVYDPNETTGEVPPKTLNFRVRKK